MVNRVVASVSYQQWISEDFKSFLASRKLSKKEIKVKQGGFTESRVTWLIIVNCCCKNPIIVQSWFTRSKWFESVLLPFSCPKVLAFRKLPNETRHVSKKHTKKHQQIKLNLTQASWRKGTFCILAGRQPQLLSKVKALEVFVIHGEHIASESQVTLSAIPLP